jgi:dolichyl-phosphate-mannose--protein O-mannosyl transferase
LQLLRSAALRFWGINFGLPYTYAPDETWHLSVALGILKTGDLNPYWLGYPHLAFYLNAILLFFHYIGGRLLGAFTSTADLPYPDVLTVGVGRLDMPAEFLLARGLTALFGSASILLVYLIGRRLHPSSFVGLAGALFFAISPANVYNSP